MQSPVITKEESQIDIETEFDFVGPDAVHLASQDLSTHSSHSLGWRRLRRFQWARGSVFENRIPNKLEGRLAIQIKCLV